MENSYDTTHWLPSLISLPLSSAGVCSLVSPSKRTNSASIRVLGSASEEAQIKTVFNQI